MINGKRLLRTACGLVLIGILSNVSCVSSEKGLGDIRNRVASERVTKTEEVPGEPQIKMVDKPSATNPDIKMQLFAEMIKRESVDQNCERTEKTQMTTSGEGMLILGGVTMGGGFFWWFINTLMALPDSTVAGTPAGDAKNAANKANYQPKANQGAMIGLLGLVPLIIGASTDQKVTTFDKVTGHYTQQTHHDTPLGRTVPLKNLMVVASVNNDQGTFSTSKPTDQEGNVDLQIDNKLSDTLALAKDLPGNLAVSIEPAGGQKTYLNFSLQEAIAIISHGTIDWSAGAEGLTPYPETRLEIGGSPKASETVILKIVVSNKKGKGDCYQLQGLIKSDEPLFNRRILVGLVKAGQEITVEQKVEIPRLWQDRVIPLTITFDELHKNIPDPIEARLTIEGLPRPGLGYSCRIIDDGSGNSVGNGDGMVQKGEAVDIEVTVNNTGAVLAKDVKARVSFEQDLGEGIMLQRDSLMLGDLVPNESKKGRFTLVIKKIAQVNEFKLNLDITETGLNVSTKDTIPFKIGAATEAKAIVMSPKPAYVQGEEINVHGGASADTTILYRSKKNSPLTIIAQIGDWYKIDFGNNRVGWVAKDDVSISAPKETPSTSASATPSVIEVMQKAPPLIVLASPNKNNIETTDQVIKIAGTAGDASSVEKVDILINGQLIKSLSTRGINVVERNPKTPGEKVTSYSFEQEVALNMGQNEIRIIAYNDEDLTRSQTIKVNRIEPRGEVYLVSVGISTYDDASIRALTYAEDDARAIADFYRTNPTSPVKPENITTLYGKQATSKGIRKAISELAKKAKDFDTVIFYYAGHGDVGKHPNKGTEYYLIPVDAEKDDLFSTAIEMSELQRLWSAVVTKRKIFIADACNSGGFTDLRGDVDGFERGMGEGTIVMTASSRGQKALEAPELKHGLFTYYLLQGLNGQAAENGEKRISVSELKKYLDKEVGDKAKELGSVQTPVIKIETTGEIYLTK